MTTVSHEEAREAVKRTVFGRSEDRVAMARYIDEQEAGQHASTGEAAEGMRRALERIEATDGSTATYQWCRWCGANVRRLKRPHRDECPCGIARAALALPRERMPACGGSGWPLAGVRQCPGCADCTPQGTDPKEG